jgi:hypothetical protein
MSWGQIHQTRVNNLENTELSHHSSTGKKNVKEAKETSTAEKGNSAQIEFAGNAHALSSQVNARASTDWNPDTGASIHMSPHRQWFHSYSPHIVPV